MFTKKIFPVFIFLLISVLFFSCKKEEAQLADLNFQVVKINEEYHCSWTMTNISSFDKLHILHAPFPLKEWERIEDVRQGWKSTFYTQDKNLYKIVIPTHDNLPINFQLYIDIGDRILISDRVVLGDDSAETINSEANFGYHHPAKNTFYFKSEGKLSSYNYLEREEKQGASSSTNFVSNKYAYSNNEFGEEIYLSLGNNLYVIDANTLIVKETIEVSYQIFSIAANDNGLIVITSSASNVPLQVISRAEMNILNTFSTYNPSYNSLSIVSLSKDENRFMEVGRDWLRHLKLDEQGQVIGQDLVENVYAPTSSHNIIALSPLGNYIIYSKNGYIYDSSMNGVKDLSSILGATYNSFFFEEESFLYAISNEFDPDENYFIDKFSIPDFEFVERKNYEVKKPVSLFSRDGEVQAIFLSESLDFSFVEQLDF